jgi:protoporphyrinogen IX oxidase
MLYPFLKAIHLICVVSWFAGLFYIFRLFVYHVQNWDKAQVRSVFETMERKLLNIIVIPAGAASLVSGVALLVVNPELLSRNWMWFKFLFVAVLIGYSVLSCWVHRSFVKNRLVFTERACRWLNEVPTIALIAISLLVFLKPR